jgi:putative hemolysin
MHGLLFLSFVVCLAISFLMSGMEAGVFALSRLRIRQKVRSGDRRAQVLYGYLEDPETFLWIILVGNTVANVSIATISLLGLHELIGPAPGRFVLVMLAGGVLFYAFCELLPKMLFRVYPNRLCLLLAGPFRAVHFTVRPLVSLMSLFANSLLRWSGGKRFTGRLFGSRDELRILMQESAQGLTTEERAMINHVLDLQHLTAGQIAIPLSKTASASIQTPVSELLALSRERGFNRFPVWKKENERTRLVGVVNVRELLFAEKLDLTKTAGDYLKPVLFLDRDLRLEVALQQMQRTGQRLAIVLGPDRAELGVLSLQDILQVIFGEVR